MAAVLSARDFEIMLSVPSLTGLVCGKNSLLGETENFEKINNSFNYSIQGFGDIASVNYCTFAYTAALNFYTENHKDTDSKAFQLGVSLGAGVFFNSWKSYINLEEKEMLPLTGSCVFIYPVYEMPVVRIGGTPYWDWKYAIEAGLNYTFMHVSVYPFFRGIGMERDVFKNMGIAFDAGVLIGLYL